MDNRDGVGMSDILDRLRAHREGAPTIPIEIPEWGLSAFVRPISSAKHASIRKHGNEARMSAHFIMESIVDEKGKPIFPNDAHTIAELEGQPSNLIGRVTMEILGHMNADFDAKNS